MHDAYTFETDPTRTPYPHPRPEIGPGIVVLRLREDELEPYRAFVGKDGLLHKADGTLLDTSTMGKGKGIDEGWGIFIMDKHENLYVGDEMLTPGGMFKHSTLSNGEEVIGSGGVKVSNGLLMELGEQSGHYYTDGMGPVYPTGKLVQQSQATNVHGVLQEQGIFYYKDCVNMHVEPESVDMDRITQNKNWDWIRTHYPVKEPGPSSTPPVVGDGSGS
jgi:hypothetical protein